MSELTEALNSLLYFHGSVDLEECRELLPDVGDFLIRNADRMMGASKSTVFCILTVAVVPDTQQQSVSKTKDARDTSRLKTHSISNNPDGSYSIQGAPETFPAVQALCEFWLESKKPLPSGGTLTRGVPRKPYELLRCDIELPEPEILLGKGSYGKVIRGKMAKREGFDQKEVAIKTANEGAEQAIRDVFLEARAMRLLKHANIIGLEGVVVERIPLMLVIELFDGSCLQSALQKKAVNDTMRFPVCCAIMYALLYMHSNGFIHRDVAARNVMVSADCRKVKLIDFGLAKQSLQFTMTVPEKIPVRWLAPEVIERFIFSTKSDVWALAVTIWEVYHDGAEPYPNLPNNAVKSAVLSRSSAAKKKGGVEISADLKITENLAYLPKHFEMLFTKMMTKGTRHRPELGHVAAEIERVILPTLPKPVQDELRRHMETRPPYNSKMAGPVTDDLLSRAEISNDGLNPPPPGQTPPSPNTKNQKTVTRRRAKKQGAKEGQKPAAKVEESKKRNPNVTGRRKARTPAK